MRIKSSLAPADHSETVVRRYRLSRRDAIARRAHAIAWFVGLLCAAIFIFDGIITRVVLSLFASWLFLDLFFETVEATIDDEGVCEFRSLLRRKQIRAHQVRSVRGGPSDDSEESNDIFIRYDRGRVSLPGEDFVGLVQDLLALNPEIKLDLADGWFRRMVDRSPSSDEHVSSDDPIGDLRRFVYEEPSARADRPRQCGSRLLVPPLFRAPLPLAAGSCETTRGGNRRRGYLRSIGTATKQDLQDADEVRMQGTRRRSPSLR